MTLDSPGELQLILIDARGQVVPADVLDPIPTNIGTASGHILTPADVVILH
jgi:hypothetical protein